MNRLVGASVGDLIGCIVVKGGMQGGGVGIQISGELLCLITSAGFRGRIIPMTCDNSTCCILGISTIAPMNPWCERSIIRCMDE